MESVLTTSAVVCMYLLVFLFVLCVVYRIDSLVDQPQAEGTFHVQIKTYQILAIIYLPKSSVIQKYKFDHPGAIGFFFSSPSFSL